MPYLSKQTIIGHLGKDVEYKRLSNSEDKGYYFFTVAVNAGYGDKKVTNWFDVISFRQMPEWKVQKLVKGATVLVIGDFKFTVTEKNGKNYSHLNINAETIEVLPKDTSKEEGQAVSTDFDDDTPPF